MTCTRCKKNEAQENKARCINCSNYANAWQTKQTKERRANKQCISCGLQTPETLDEDILASRCNGCTVIVKNNNKNKIQKIVLTT